MSSLYDDRRSERAGTERADAAPAPYSYLYPPAGTYAHGYDSDYYVDEPALSTRRTIRRSLIVAAVGVLAVLAVLAAFSWFLSERSASRSAVPATSPTVTSVPAPWGGGRDLPGFDSAPQPAPSDEGTDDVEAARAEAEALLGHAGFSRRGLIEVLSTPGAGQSFYTRDVAAEAVDSLGVDWTEQARRAGQDLVDGDMGFSPSSLHEFLIGEGMGGFTREEADAGVAAVVADWNAEAVKAARFNLREGLSTPGTLLQDLEAEGFTTEQASDAVAAVDDGPAQRRV